MFMKTLFFFICCLSFYAFAGKNIVIPFDSTRTQKEILDSLLNIHKIDSSDYMGILSHIDSMKTTEVILPKFNNPTGIIKGTRVKRDIINIIMEKLHDIRMIYIEKQKAEKRLNGNLVIQMIILPNGNLVNCTVLESSTSDNDFDESILNEVKKWKFNKITDLKDTTIVNYPFVFKN